MSRRNFSIVFVPTWSCNASCRYCFESKTHGTVADADWCRLFVKFAELAEVAGAEALSVYWQGGEVLTLDPARVAAGVEICSEIFTARGMAVEHNIQTNLLLYDRRWGETILRHFGGRVSSSLDYPNRHRMTPVLKAEEYNRFWLEKKRAAEDDGLQVGVITLPNSGSLDLGAERWFRYFHEEAGLKRLQVNFPFPGAREREPERLDLERLADFMGALHRTWLDSGRAMEVDPFSLLAKVAQGGAIRLPCIWSYSCAGSLCAVGPSGEVGLCDCWISSQQQFDYGRLLEASARDVFLSCRRDAFLARPLKLIRDAECSRCRFLKICFGGCPLRAYAFTGEVNDRDHYCPVYRRIFSDVFGNGAPDGFDGTVARREAYR